MPNDVVTVRLSTKHATFLQANLGLLATTTRQAMTRPGLGAERRSELANRASLLEAIEDAVHGALLEAPQEPRKGTVRAEHREPLQTGSRVFVA